MDAKELNETTTRLYARLRELSQEKLSKPITVKRKKETKSREGSGSQTIAIFSGFRSEPFSTPTMTTS